jgi:hypothetical protein
MWWDMQLIKKTIGKNKNPVEQNKSYKFSSYNWEKKKRKIR